jgi:DNA mismatch repair protein MutL
MPIRQLPDSIINQIAAGEVVERPASVVKELVENALDAGASSIDIAIQGGGLTLIRVADTGHGMAADDLPLAVARHCTSKLDGAIDDIRWLGFRGEALPSIGSVSKLRIVSRRKDGDCAFGITVNGGVTSSVGPAALNGGTLIEVRDLFFNLPARLKFLRSPTAETQAVADIVRRIALARPDVGFSFSADSGGVDTYPAAIGDDALRNRVRQVLGADLAASGIDIDAEREAVRLYGTVSPPSLNRANSRQQFLYVNGRAVRDRQLLGALAGAYADRLPRGRYASAALFIEIEPRLVDVNVHPAKAEVRFRDPGLVRGLIVGAVREALDRQGLASNRAATTQFVQLARGGSLFGAPMSGGATRSALQAPYAPLAEARPPIEAMEELPASTFAGFAPQARGAEPAPEHTMADASPYRLGAAKAQIHRNYIVAQTAGSLILVDQHAAHERLVYEGLKRGLDANGAPAQMLLIPEIVELPASDAARVLRHAELLARFGLMLEGFGEGAIAVTGTPSMLGETDARALVIDLADDIAENDTPDSLRRRLDRIAATIACHGSVRSGRELRLEEMNALLRQMEATPGSDTCNHGRPTFVELRLEDIERLFERR